MKPILRNTLIILGLVLIDQISKYFFEATKAFINLSIFSLHYVQNTGASFGMLQGSNALLAWISIIVIGIIMTNVKKITKEYALPIIILVSGILGNLIDRILRGFVVDMIDFKWWPVFNIADMLIVISVVWIIILLLIEEKNDSNKKSKTKKKKSKN